LGDVLSNHIDFLRLDPRGSFYLLRILQDDLRKQVVPGRTLEPIVAILRVAEAIAVGLAFVKALGFDDATTKLAYAFQWTRLKGRELAGSANPQVLISSGYVAHDG